MKNLFTKTQIINNYSQKLQDSQSQEYYTPNLILHNARPPVSQSHQIQESKSIQQIQGHMRYKAQPGQQDANIQSKDITPQEIYLNLSSYRNKYTCETFKNLLKQKESMLKSNEQKESNLFQQQRPTRVRMIDSDSKVDIVGSSKDSLFLTSKKASSAINLLNNKYRDNKQNISESYRSLRIGQPLSQHSTCVGISHDTRIIQSTPSRKRGMAQGWLDMGVIQRNEKWKSLRDQKTKIRIENALDKELQYCTFSPQLCTFKPKKFSLIQNLYSSNNISSQSPQQKNKHQPSESRQTEDKLLSRSKQSYFPDQSISKAIRQVSSYESLHNIKVTRQSNDGFLGIKEIINFRREKQL